MSFLLYFILLTAVPFWAAHTYLIRQLYKGVSPACKILHQSASSFELAVKHAVCLDKNMLQVLCCFTDSGSCYRIHQKRSIQGPFQKRNLLSLLKVPDVQILEVEEKKTKQWVIILRSFSILPSHSAVGTSETGYHYYLRPLQRYHICNIFQGVYEVLLCQRIQTNQIGTMYEPFSCCI